MMLFQIIIVLSVILSSYQLQFPVSLINKPQVVVKEVSQCEDQGTRDIVWDLKLKRISRQEVVLQGNLTMNIPMDSKVGGVIFVAVQSNGAWVERGYTFKLSDYCRDISLTVNSWWSNFWQHAGIPPPITCPIPKGKYVLKGFSAAQDIPPIPGLKYGVFKSELQFMYKNGPRVGCVQIIFQSIPGKMN